MERVFYHIIDGEAVLPFRPPYDMVCAQLAPAWKEFKRVSHPVAAWSVEQFLNSYHGRKRGLYARAAAKLGQGWTWQDVKRWARYKAFVKHEKLPVKPGKRLVPRAIQPRDPLYNILVGCYVKAYEKPIFHMIQEMYRSPTPVVAKGLDVVQLGGHIQTNFNDVSDCVVVGLDLSRFDQHISKSMLMWEHRWYKRLAMGDAVFAKILAYQLDNYGDLFHDSGAIRYHTEGGRGSGDMNTSLGNSLIMASIIYSFLYNQNLLHETRVMVNGDDSLIFIPRRFVNILDELPKFFESIGFVLTVEPMVDVLEKVSFCQMQPVFNGEKYVMCRNYPDAIHKDLHTTQSCKSLEYYRNYMSTVGEAGVALTAGIPIYQSFYETLYGLGTPLKRDEIGDFGMLQWVGRLQPRHLSITPEARVSFYLAFDVLPDHQKHIERCYDKGGNLAWQLEQPIDYDPNGLLLPGGCSRY